MPTNALYKNSRLFYSSFVEAIPLVVKTLIEDKQSSLSPDQVGAILMVADAFQERFILENASRLLSDALNDERSFLRVALCILESTACEANPGIIASLFTDLPLQVPTEALLIGQLCDEMRQYWQNVSREHVGESSLRLEAYRELQGGYSHDLDHRYRDLLMKIEDRVGEGMQEDWVAYRSNLRDILSRVRLVISSGVSSDLCISLEKKSSSLMRQLNALDESVESRNERLSPEDDEAFLELLKLGASETKSAWDDIGNDLNKLRTNLKERLYVVLLNYREDLEKKGIKTVRQLPDDSCLVFGESTEISVALNNLIDNVCRWSQAKRLYIDITIDQSSQSVRLRMFDDGVGMKDDLSGIGLTRIKEIASALYGRFSLSRVPKGNVRFKEGFRTVAELYLPSVPVRGNPA